MKIREDKITMVNTMAERENVLIPVFKWNGQKYGNCSIKRIFAILDNHELGKATYKYESRTNSFETELPMIQIPTGVIALRVSLVGNIYKCRLQVNSLIESSPHTLGHFRPYKSNHLVVLINEGVDLNQVIQDLENRMVIVDPNPIDADEMIKLNSDPHCWLRQDSEPFLIS